MKVGTNNQIQIKSDSIDQILSYFKITLESLKNTHPRRIPKTTNRAESSQLNRGLTALKYPWTTTRWLKLNNLFE